ncbi:hypothetical protein GCM10009799_20400 [Nocardiopsis rhodophaea]|uniref:Uncharacterized protein n=1 Tax=Nocardiopsis rhodophaea TaxID=280238 RepID=A0ABN2SXC3_9ACTN
MTSANDFLMSGGVPAAKFETLGATITGTITMPPEKQQQTDFTTGDPLTWPDGKPKEQIKVVLSTDQRDPSDPYDDGKRAVYIKSGMFKAVRVAVRASGAPGLEVGGTLTITYTGNGTPSRPGLNPPKQYEATYAPPSPGTAANDVLMGGDQSPAPAPATQQAPAPAPSATPAPAAPAAGVPSDAAAALAQLTPEQRAALGL